jgi:hypothetical protein
MPRLRSESLLKVEGMTIKNRLSLAAVGMAGMLIGGAVNAWGQGQLATIRQPVNGSTIERFRERWVVFYDNDGYDMDGNRVDGNPPVTLYNPRTMEELSITLEHLPLDPVSDLADTYWDVNTGTIYCATTHGHEPPWVELHVTADLSSMRIRNATGELGQFMGLVPVSSTSPQGQYRLSTSWSWAPRASYAIVSFTVVSVADETQVWRGTSGDPDLGYALYWIDDRWLWPRKGLTASQIVDVETGQYRSFAPDFVIGYGSGAIVTIAPDSQALRVCTPSGEVIYEEQQVDPWRLFPTAYHPGVCLAYYDDPYVYVILADIGGVANTGVACCIINTRTGSQAITVGANSEFLGVYYPDSPGFVVDDGARSDETE